MGYRDDTEAAQARAAALERELAEKQAALETKAELLAEREAELAETRAALEKTEDEKQRAERSSAEEHAARRKLERLRERAAEREAKRKARERTRRKSARPELSEAERRVQRSCSLFAESEYTTWLMVFGLPGFYFTVYMSIRFNDMKGLPLIGGFALTAGLAWLCWRAGLGWASSRPEAEDSWAKSLPYALVDYPRVLASAPKTRGSSGGHTRLSVHLQFRNRAPDDLGVILEGFDDKLEGVGMRYSRPSPRDERRSRHGSVSILDSNRAVRDWVHRFERKVLRHLHNAHGLASVTIKLT